MVHNISAVILAGGVNKRFNGITKANIVINGKTIILRIIETLNDIFEEIIIVTNTPEEFKEFTNCKLVRDHFIKTGPLGGIHAALKASSKGALFIFAGDMPLLDKKIIIKQLEFYNNQKCDILVPLLNNYIEPLHAIYNVSIVNTLEDYLTRDNNNAVREFLKKVNVCYQQLEDSEEAKNAFTNINFPSDISIVERILKG